MTNYGLTVSGSKNTPRFTSTKQSLLVDLNADPSHLTFIEYTFTSDTAIGENRVLATLQHNMGYIPLVLCYIYCLDAGGLSFNLATADTYSRDPLVLGSGVFPPYFHTKTTATKLDVVFSVPSGAFGNAATNGSKWRFKIYLFSAQGLN